MEVREIQLISLIVMMFLTLIDRSSRTSKNILTVLCCYSRSTGTERVKEAWLFYLLDLITYS